MVVSNVKVSENRGKTSIQGIFCFNVAINYFATCWL